MTADASAADASAAASRTGVTELRDALPTDAGSSGGMSYRRSTIACANWLVFTSVAPSIRRAKS